ncbi:hypothetical protein L2E82_15367 [Cichorium intybus]|uniref:Uncharacterized protein n=1 Tax=Cichorium intybus TaxID=13427 RepID=A0ACB9F2M2_CICIN|nr:hypothetical protein L2E82_15367 [Cichorium intybus]
MTNDTTQVGAGFGFSSIGVDDRNANSTKDLVRRKRRSSDTYLVIGPRTGPTIASSSRSPLPLAAQSVMPPSAPVETGQPKRFVFVPRDRLLNMKNMKFVETMASIAEVMSRYEACWGIEQKNQDMRDEMEYIAGMDQYVFVRKELDGLRSESVDAIRGRSLVESEVLELKEKVLGLELEKTTIKTVFDGNMSELWKQN